MNVADTKFQTSEKSPSLDYPCISPNQTLSKPPPNLGILEAANYERSDK